MWYHETPQVSSRQQFLTHMLKTLARFFAIGIPTAMFVFVTCANAQDAKPGDTAYYCERSGSSFWSIMPCEEIGGTELRRGRVADPSESRSPPPVNVPVDASKSIGVPENSTSKDIAQTKSMSAEKPAAQPDTGDATAMGKTSAKGKGTFLNFLPFLVVYFGFSAILGWWASTQKRSFWVWVFLSLIFTPSLIFWALPLHSAAKILNAWLSLTGKLMGLA